MQEILFVIILAGGMIGSGIYVGIVSGYWHLLWVFLTFFGCFGFWEWHAVKTTGLSISQQLWKFGEMQPKGFWVVIGALIASWLALMWHFASKKFGRKNDKK